MAGKILVFVLFFAILQLSMAQTPCTTPEGGPGDCIILSSCPSLYDLIRIKPVQPQNSKLIRKSNCGFTPTLPKVCCPTGPSPSLITRIGSTDNPLIPGLTSCGQNIQDRIFGGTLTDLQEFPWMALLQYQKQNVTQFNCGGVLISSRYVLTAAHCVKGSSIPSIYKLISVRLGEHTIDTDPDCIDKICAHTPIDIPVESSEPHSEYVPNDRSQLHDIALLRLARTVEFTDYIQPICLPLQNKALLNQTFDGYDLHVAGWGKTEISSKSMSKLQVRVPVVEQSICKEKFRPLNAHIQNTQICAGGKAGQDSCRGDSGGPLMGLEFNDGQANWYVLGVVSYGMLRCGSPGWPGVYTKVGAYSEWISSKIVA